ncbi:MAG: trigger factor [Chitinophagaceae bacterium]
MANVQQQNIGKYHEKISVVISKEDYLPTFEKSLKSYAKNANIPGFRKGMVPAGLVKKQYGPSIFADEVMRVAGNELEKHLISTKAEIFARPLPAMSNNDLSIDMNNPGDYTFEFEIGTRPAFTLNLLDGNTAFDVYKITITDDMLREEAERLQLKSGEMTEPDAITSEHNVINIHFNAIDANGNVSEDNQNFDNSLLVRYFTPAVQTQLMGKQKGDTLDIVLKDAIDSKILPAILKDLGMNPADENAGNASYRMTIDKVALVEKVPMDKTLFDKVYPGRNIESEEDFMSELRNEMESYFAHQGRQKLHNDLFERLVHETSIELPETFLKKWMSEGGEKFKSMEEVEREWSSFEHQLRWQLITDRIMEEHKLSVEQEELEQGARAQIMSYFGQMGGISLSDTEWMEPLVKKQLQDNKFRNELQDRIITDKLFNQLESMVKLSEKEISLEDFSKLPSLHHHHH